MAVSTAPVNDELSFGCRMKGVTEESLRDEAVRENIRRVFDDRGLIIFEDKQPSNRLQMELGLRVLHAVSGTTPPAPRSVYRSTIRGDYGLGRFEHGKAPPELLEPA